MKKHGLTKHRLYMTWRQMLYRCYRESNHNYHLYGGRGIKVCDRWHNIVNFIEDTYPTWQEGLQLDRKDNDGNYEPDNVRWATKSQNMKNRSNRSVEQSNVDFVCYYKPTKSWRLILDFNTKEEAEQFAKKVLS